MARVFIRTLENTKTKTFWHSEGGMERLRAELNECGFYVIHGVGESLDVYAVETGTMDLKLEAAILAGLVGAAWLLS